MALQFAASDVALQTHVALALIRHGRYAEAMHLRATLGLQDWVEEITPERVRAHEEQRRETTLSLPPHLPVTAINFVDSRESLARAAAAVDAYLERACAHAAGSDVGRGSVLNMWKEQRVEDVFVVGLDVEWKPAPLGSSVQNRASILQVAWRQEIIILDLLWMHRTECVRGSRAGEAAGVGQEGEVRMSGVIQKLLTSECVLKLGFDFATDLSKLKASYPELACFTSVSPFLDIAAWSWSLNGSKGNSLRRTVERCLKVDLDKQQQMSDWECRPLSLSQLHYAALDAYVLCSIFDSFPSSSTGACTPGKWAKMVHTLDVKSTRRSKADKCTAVDALNSTRAPPRDTAHASHAAHAAQEEAAGGQGAHGAHGALVAACLRDSEWTPSQCARPGLGDERENGRLLSATPNCAPQESRPECRDSKTSSPSAGRAACDAISAHGTGAAAGTQEVGTCDDHVAGLQPLAIQHFCLHLKGPISNFPSTG